MKLEIQAIAQSYLGMKPKDKGCKTWIEMQEKMTNEIISVVQDNSQTTEQPDLPAPNTVMWWLCRIADPEIRRKAVGNCLSYHVTSKTKAQDLNEAIGAGFMWSHTQEKRGYWKYLRCGEIPLLPEPDFTEYNELRN